jgi:hypothetical protein
MNETPNKKKARRIPRFILIWLALFAVIVLAIVFLQHPEGMTNLYWGRILVTGLVSASVPICLWLGARWSFRSWRNFRRLLIGLAILATLVAALVTEEDWRGRHDWESYKLQLEAKGEKLDWQAFVPPPVPNDQNFFCAPIVAEALNVESNENTIGSTPRATAPVNPLKFDIYRGDSANWPSHGGNWQKGTFTDLAEWQKYFRTYDATPAGRTNGFPVSAQPQSPAADVLLALSVFNPPLEELRQASLRPAARLPLNYSNGFEDTGKVLPWLAQEKRCAQLLQLRTSAELQDNQSEAALQDVKFALRLIDTLRSQPFLISHLVRIAMQAIALQPIYEGLAQHRWNDAQLASLEAALGQKNYLADFQFATRGERTCAIATFELQRHTRETKSYAIENGSEIGITNSLRWMPSAYFYQNEIAFARMYEQLVLPLVDLTNRTVSLAAYRTDEVDITNMMKHYSPYTVQALMAFPAVGRSVQKFAIIQAQVDLARVACALERYRLAHGEYPESLDALAPQFIEKVPHDIINGQPLHYRRMGDQPSQGSGPAGGTFVLYSVGWNEKDDDGVVAFRKGSSNVDPEKGDWVWKN